MIERILNKHVQIGLICGTVLEGFVSGTNDSYFDLIEYNNSLVIIRLQDVSFVRLNKKDCCCEKPCKESKPVKEGAQVAAIVSKPRKNEFSMPNPNVDGIDNGLYERPSFVRTTKRNGEE